MNSIKGKKSLQKALKRFGNVKHSSYLYYINKKRYDSVKCSRCSGW